MRCSFSYLQRKPEVFLLLYSCNGSWKPLEGSFIDVTLTRDKTQRYTSNAINIRVCSVQPGSGFASGTLGLLINHEAPRPSGTCPSLPAPNGNPPAASASCPASCLLARRVYRVSSERPTTETRASRPAPRLREGYLLDGSLRGRVRRLRLLQQLEYLLKSLLVWLPLALHLAVPLRIETQRLTILLNGRPS